MKIIFPLIICSAIAAALGYYFGRISAPTSTEKTSAPPAMTAPAQPEVVEPELAPEPEPMPEPAEESATASDENAEPEEETSFAERAAATTQTLTDTQGRSIEVSILEVMADQVRIRRSDGLKTTIPLDMLSEEDVAFCNYLREQAAEREQKAEKPATSDGFDWDAYFNS